MPIGFTICAFINSGYKVSIISSLTAFCLDICKSRCCYSSFTVNFLVSICFDLPVLCFNQGIISQFKFTIMVTILTPKY